jgi:dsRNA-specific ribonuclease
VSARLPADFDLIDALAKVGALEERLGYTFNDRMIGVEALRTRGGAMPIRFKGVDRVILHNKRLALLGDRVLTMALCETWYKAGQSAFRYACMEKLLVTRSALNKRGIALKLQASILSPYHTLGLDAPKDLYGETFEAIIGAIYADSGYNLESVICFLDRIGMLDSEFLQPPPAVTTMPQKVPTTMIRKVLDKPATMTQKVLDKAIVDPDTRFKVITSSKKRRLQLQRSLQRQKELISTTKKTETILPENSGIKQDSTLQQLSQQSERSKASVPAGEHGMTDLVNNMDTGYPSTSDSTARYHSSLASALEKAAMPLSETDSIVSGLLQPEQTAESVELPTESLAQPKQMAKFGRLKRTWRNKPSIEIEVRVLYDNATPGHDILQATGVLGVDFNGQKINYEEALKAWAANPDSNLEHGSPEAEQRKTERLDFIESGIFKPDWCSLAVDQLCGSDYRAQLDVLAARKVALEASYCSSEHIFQEKDTLFALFDLAKKVLLQRVCLVGLRTKPRNYNYETPLAMRRYLPVVHRKRILVLIGCCNSVFDVSKQVGYDDIHRVLRFKAVEQLLLTSPRPTSSNESSFNEAIANEPTANEPTVNELSFNELSFNEFTVDEPTVDDASTDEPTIDEASIDEPTSIDELRFNEPTVNEPTVSESSIDESTIDEPSVNKSKIDESKIHEPSVNDPSDDESIITNFVVWKPIVGTKVHKPKAHKSNDYESNGYKPNDYKPNDYKPNDYKPNDYKPNDYKPNDYKPNDYQKESPALDSPLALQQALFNMPTRSQRPPFVIRRPSGTPHGSPRRRMGVNRPGRTPSRGRVTRWTEKTGSGV